MIHNRKSLMAVFSEYFTRTGASLRAFAAAGFILLAAGNAFVATEFVCVVDTGGTGDYTSLFAWEDAIEVDLTAASTKVIAGSMLRGVIGDGVAIRQTTTNATAVCVHHTATQMLIKEPLVGTPNSTNTWYPTANGTDATNAWTPTDTGDSAIAVADCRATTGLADDNASALEIVGWTTSNNNYIKIWTDPTAGYRHQGKWDNTKYRRECSGSGSGSFRCIRIREEYVIVDGLQVKFTSTSTGAYSGAIDIEGVSGGTAGTKNIISNNILYGLVTSSAYGIRDYTTGTVYIYNNIVYGFNPGKGISCGHSGSVYYAYNNTTYKNGTGFASTSGSTIVLKNNLSASNTTEDFDNTKNYSAGSTNNASSDSTADGNDDSDMAFPKLTRTFTFVDSALYADMHLSSSDTGARDIGAILSGDTTLPITTDIDGETRPASNWDIGADEVMMSASGAAASGTIKVAYNSTVQAQSATVSGGTWSMTGMTFPAVGDMITFWIDSAADADESVYVSKYGGSGNITGVGLTANILSIGGTSALNVSDLAWYDYNDDNDIMHSCNGTALLVDAASKYTDDTLNILSGASLGVGVAAGSETLTANNITIDGTLYTDDYAPCNISGTWMNNGIFSGNSRVTLNGTNQALYGNTTFYGLSKTVSSAAILTIDNTATITISGSLTLKGDIGQRLLLRSDVGAAYNLTVNTGVPYSLKYLDIQYCDASGGRMLDLDHSLYNTNNSKIIYDAKSMFF